MSVKPFFFRFGSGNPSTYTGLSPSFLVFRTVAGTTTAPTPFELASTGVYGFTLNTPAASVAFVIDGATTTLATTDRYVAGALDPSFWIDETGTTLVAIGTTNVAIGTTLIGMGTTNTAIGTTLIGYGVTSLAYGLSTAAYLGTTASTFGTSSVDPATVFGFLKRVLENLEGDSNYVKATGLLSIVDRTGGTTFAVKTVSDSGTVVTKT